MNAPRELICFGEDWGRHPSTAQFLVRHLLGGFRVIWINSLGWRTPRLRAGDFTRALRKVRAAARGVERPHPNLILYTPLVLPWYRTAAVRRLNAGLLHRAVDGLTRRHGFSRYTLMTTYPVPVELFHRMNRVRRVYYCADEYTSFPGLRPDLVRTLERRLLADVDVVVTTSQTLYEAKSRVHPNVVYLPHGVDTDHFAKAADPATPVPQDVASLARPIIGFFGLLADWVDVPLLREVARARPAWSVALIGNVATDVGPLKGLSNVHLLGQKPYASLPGYCRGFDVAIIPFRQNELTMRANPIKLREYLAAGKPIVSTPLPEVLQFGELAQAAECANEFVRKIEHCLSEDPSLPARRMASVRHQSWAARATELAAVL
jgi:glycosyltransferase involved in cell wall biosynthesis